MGCELTKVMKPEDVSIRVELFYQYEQLKLISGNDESDPFLKGFKRCMEIVEDRIDAVMNETSNRNT